jgi:hypothetical protein
MLIHERNVDLGTLAWRTAEGESKRFAGNEPAAKR